MIYTSREIPLDSEQWFEIEYKEELLKQIPNFKG
jgi:hypothetical protein